MKSIIFLLFALVLSCSRIEKQSTPEMRQYHDPLPVTDSSYLLRVFDGEWYELGIPCGYVSNKGDTVIPIGKYSICWSDTIRSFGIVTGSGPTQSKFIGIDQQERLLYEIHYYDNGPDWLEEGLFRIMRNGKIGYADKNGFIQIEPQFECASQFENGLAKVALRCDLIPEHEHTRMQSKEWFYIDNRGNIVKK